MFESFTSKMSEGEFLCEQTMKWYCETERTPT